MLRTVIIDDEEKSRQSLKRWLLKYCSGVGVVGVADGVASGIECIKEHKPDLVMLDIRMQDGTGFDLLKEIGPLTFQLIFTTAYDEYAVKAFKFSAVDYLLKPIDIEELEAAIDRVKTNIKKQENKYDLQSIVKNLLEFNNTDPRITISTDSTLEILRANNIIRLEADGSYTLFLMSDGRKILSSKSLKYYEELMEEYLFLRVHKSHIVNLSYVMRFLKSDGGSVELRNGDKVPISRRRRDAFMEIYKNR